MPGSEMSWMEVTRSMLSDFGDMVRSEVRLAIVEVKEQAQAAGKSAAPLVGGAVFLFYSLGFLLLCMMFALELVLPRWLSALIICIIAGLPAIAMVAYGRGRLKQLPMKPVRTIESVKETMQWAKRQGS